MQLPSITEFQGCRLWWKKLALSVFVRLAFLLPYSSINTFGLVTIPLSLSRPSRRGDQLYIAEEGKLITYSVTI
jgi:hypothetical protein